MKYMLDTHTFLWVLFDDEKLSAKSKDIIQNINNEIVVSKITYWEISLKYAIGKLELKNIMPEELPDKANEINISSIDITDAEVASFYQLPLIKHKDPFDRFIIWQAINRNLPLITKDKMISEYEKFGLKTIW